MFILSLVLVTCAILFQCDAAFVDKLPKCSIHDDECLSRMYETALTNIGSVGIPEINIPPVDPFTITNLTVNMMEFVKVTMTDGEVTGVSDCKVKKLHLDLEKKAGVQEFLCNLFIKGNIKIEGSNPALKGMFGNDALDGMGQVTVKLEKLFMHFDFPFEPTKKDDGKTYLKVSYKNIKYKLDFGKATFGSDKIIVGSEDISKGFINYINENFKTVLETLGQPFVGKAMEIFFKFSKLFYEGVPTKHYIIEDLTPYIKN